MKKIALLLFGFCFSSMLASAVQIYEPFNYPRGSDLAGQGGWVLAAGTSPKIATNALVTPGLQPASEGNSAIFGNGAMEVRRGMKNLIGGEQAGVYFYSLALKVADVGAMTPTGGFIAALSQTNPPGVYGGRLYLRKVTGGSSSNYNIGVSVASATPSDIVWSPTVFVAGQTNFVVCRYATPDQSDANTYLWINPDPSTYGAASAPAPDLTASTGLNPLTGVSQMVLHQGSVAEGPGAIIIDTVRVEGGWPHVTPVPLTMSITKTNITDVYLSWGGNQNVLLQETSSLTPPISWTNLNGGLFGDAGLRNYTVSNAATNHQPGFFRLIAWYPE
jgi:hypothetical protein